MATGHWMLCETKEKRVLYANTGNPNCPCVVYRIHNDGPAAVSVGDIHLDPGEDGDASGPRIEVALTKLPVSCPPGSKHVDQVAKGTYELLCCCCGCGDAGSASDKGGHASSLTVSVLVPLPGSAISGPQPQKGHPLRFQWTVQGAGPQAQFTFTAKILVPDMQNQEFVMTTGEEGIPFASPHWTQWGSVVFPSTALPGVLYNNQVIVTVTDQNGTSQGTGISNRFDIH